MRKATLVATLLAAMGLLFIGLACKQPSPAPPPPVKTDDSAARARSEAEAKRKAEEEARRKREEQEKITEAARLAEQNKAKAFQQAAESALRDIHFDYDKSELSTGDRETLRANAAVLKKRPSAEIQVAGHCDERGTNQYNIALGQRRANAVRNYYKFLGVKMSRMSTISYGEELPACNDSTEECWSQNRRAETLVRKK